MVSFSFSVMSNLNNNFYSLHANSGLDQSLTKLVLGTEVAVSCPKPCQRKPDVDVAKKNISSEEQLAFS